MLINTVILFLRDALPLFIILVLLLALQSRFELKKRWFIHGISLGVIFTISIHLIIDYIAQAFDGRGLEIMLIFLGFTFYLIVISYLYIALFKQKNTTIPIVHYICILTIFALGFTLNGTNFLIYLMGYWTQSGAFKSLLIGVVLGTGICTSISVLLYFFVMYIQNNFYLQTPVILLLLNAAGFVLHSIGLLYQIDILPSANLLWDLNFLINENSELGRFLTAFFGYDATPTFLQFIIYIVVLVVPLAIYLQKIHLQKADKAQEILS